MISEPLPQISSEHRRIARTRFSFPARATFLGAGLVLIGWIWPYDISRLPDYIGGSGWVLGWFTVLVLIGAACGYVLRSRWSILIAPLGLYVGGVIHWFHMEYGMQAPPWAMFALVSAISFGVLLITTGTAAGVAARVIAVESELIRPTEGIRRSAAFAALLGLLAITAVYVLPTPFIGALLGLASLLAGAGLMEEERVNGRERMLAVVGMMVGLVAIGTQLLALWSLIKNF